MASRAQELIADNAFCGIVRAAGMLLPVFARCRKSPSAARAAETLDAVGTERMHATRPVR